jgi:glycine/sarcosine/betaine reductase complex component A
MDPENQSLIQAIVEREGAENTVVVLGAGDTEALEVAAETVTRGDPSYVGPLAGVQLGLPVMHIFEDEVKQQVDPTVYAEKIGFLELSLETDAVRAAMKRIRGEEQ